MGQFNLTLETELLVRNSVDGNAFIGAADLATRLVHVMPLVPRDAQFTHYPVYPGLPPHYAPIQVGPAGTAHAQIVQRLSLNQADCVGFTVIHRGATLAYIWDSGTLNAAHNHGDRAMPRELRWPIESAFMRQVQGLDPMDID